MVKVGDVISHERGVEGTEIPLGATVRYSTGVDQRTGDYTVVAAHGGKMLGYEGCPLWEGFNGPMTVLSLPSLKGKP